MTISILLLLPKALLQSITNASSYCNTIAITIWNIICLKETKDFHKALVLMLFESHTISVIFDELSTC